MLKIVFPFVENKHFHYNFKSLLDIVLNELDYRLYTPESQNLMDFLLSYDEGWEGPFGTPVCLNVNSKEMINGSSVAVSSTLNFLLKLNNAVYYLLNGQKKAEVYVSKIFRKEKKFTLNLELEVQNSELIVSFNVPVLEEVGRGEQSKYISIKNQRVHFYQAVEEVIEAIKKYQEVYLKAVQIISPKDVETIKRLYFSSEGKLDFSDIPWLPLEQAWIDYKKQHHITDEDVKKAIAEEEVKEKKIEKRWWQVWK